MGRVQQACFALLTLLFALPVWADKPAPLSAQTLKVPSGPASLKGLGESFEANPSSGTGSYAIPISLPPGFLAPSLSLRYAGGTGRSEVGVGFQLPIFQVYRLTDKGAPKFDETDRFAVSGPEYNDELVLVDAVKRLYRMKNEGAFVLFQRDSAADSWLVLHPTGMRSVLGGSSAARAAANGKSARWYISSTVDPFGHALTYRYFSDQGKVYWQGADYQQEADVSYRNRVELGYEPRTDPIRDYRYGDLCLTAQRLKTISVFQGARLLRVYTLRYADDAPWSVLARVGMAGEDGTSMPTLSLSYVLPTRRSGRFVRTQGTPSLTGFDTGRMTLEDVTGDGLPDLLNSDPSNYAYYENIDGLRFSSAAVSLGASGSPDRGLDATGVVLADVDGDGYRDVWYPTGDGRFRYFSGGRIDHGRFLGFGAAQLMNGNNVISDVTKPEARLTDLNGDGRTDLLQQRPGLADVWVENQLGRDLVQRSMPALPAGVQLNSPALELADFNGDGILDLVLKEFDASKHDLKVWYDLGSGKFWPTVQDVPAPSASPREVFLSDVDRDGQLDLIRVSGSWVSYYLNDGRNRFDVPSGEFYGMPETSRTKRVLMADMNGNGTSDVVWFSLDGQLSYLDLMEDPGVGLISRIDNGLGMVTDISYRPSTDYAINAKIVGSRWQTPLPHPVCVISEVAVRDSLENLGVEGWETRSTYDYEDGFYDGKEREFRGFAHVTISQPGDEYQEGKATEVRMHVGRNLATGADEESLKGKVWLKLDRSIGGALFNSQETKWEQRWLCQEDLGAGAPVVLPSCAGISDKVARKDELSSVALPLGTLSGAWERQATPRYAASVTTYDVWTNPTRVDQYGEVSFSAGHQLGQPWTVADLNTKVGDDEVFAETDYVNLIDIAAGKWFIGYATEGRVRSAAGPSGPIVKRSQTFYDGPPLVGLPLGQLSKGLVTRQASWLAEESRWVPTIRKEFNADGLPIQLLDPTGVATTVVYDSAARIFPIEERQALEANRVALYLASYDRGQGLMTSFTDPNGLITRFQYDSLGRLIKVIDPLGTDQQPFTTFSYEYGSTDVPISKTITKQLADRARGTYRTSLTFSDGLGRMRLVKAQAEQGFVASGWQKLSPLGTSIRSSAPFWSNNGDFEAPSANSWAEAARYDALLRPLEQYFPVTNEQGASFRSFEYRPFETRGYSEKDSTEGTFAYPAVTRVDGRGRVRQIEKRNQVGAQSTSLLWTLDYDSLGRLTSLKDPRAFQRSYGYNSLGQLRSVADPNLGTLQYTYDDAGRPKSRTDALGQQVVNEYGSSGRLARQTLQSRNAQGALQTDAEYLYHYDAAQAGGPLASASNLIGRVSWLEHPTGSDHFSYDNQGRTAVHASVLWDGVSSFASQARTTFIARSSYNVEGQQTRRELPGGFALDQGYNARGLLTQISGGLAQDTRDILRQALYDERGRATLVDQGNGLRLCNQHNARNQVTNALFTKATDTTCSTADFARAEFGLHHLAYDWDYDGQLAGVTDLSVTRPGYLRRDATYGYDRMSQLISATGVLGNWQYSYDTIQNLTRIQKQQGSTPILDQALLYGEAAGPNAVTHVGSLALSYDAVGQLARYNGFDLKFDALGRLIQATKSGVKTLQYYYDAFGQRRVLVATTAQGSRTVYRYPTDDYQERAGDPVWLVNTPTQLVELRQAQGLRLDAILLDELTSYVNAPNGKPKPLPAEWLDLDGDGDGFDGGDLAAAQQAFWQNRPAGTSRLEWRFDQRDHLGSSILVTDRAGDVVSSRHYEPYGATAQRTGLQPSYGFASSEVEPDEDLGLIRMGVRYYAPALGRWVTPDRSIGESPTAIASNVLDANLYSYASNTPTLRIDPTGSLPDDPKRAANLKTMGILSTIAPIPLWEAVLASPTLRPRDVLDSARAGTLTSPSLHPGSTFQGTVGEAIIAAQLRNPTGGLPFTSPITQHVFFQPATTLIPDGIVPDTIISAFGDAMPDLLVVQSGWRMTIGEAEMGEDLVWTNVIGPETSGRVDSINFKNKLVYSLWEVTTQWDYDAIMKRATDVAIWAGALPKNGSGKAVLCIDRGAFFNLSADQQATLRNTVVGAGGYISLERDFRANAQKIARDTQKALKTPSGTHMP